MTRHPELDDDVRAEYRREAIAEARLDAFARELGFSDHDEYVAANEELHERPDPEGDADDASLDAHYSGDGA